MGKRAVALVSAVLASLAFCVAIAQGAPAKPQPIATLDPSFGTGGVVKLAPEPNGLGALGMSAPDGDIILSAGQKLQALTSAGAPDPAYGNGGTVAFTEPSGGTFYLSDFTIDAKGRVLAIGTAEFPAAKSIPSTGSGEPVVRPSALRIFRFLPDGAPDPSFGSGGVVETDLGLPPPTGEDGKPLQPQAAMGASGIAVDPHGRIVVTGYADTGLGPSCEHDIFNPLADAAGFVARLTEAGALDSSFGKGGVVGGRNIDETPLHSEGFGFPVIGPSGVITYTGGGTRCSLQGSRSGLAQLGPNGEIRTGVGKEGVVGGRFNSLAARPDGSVIALATVPEGEYYGGRVTRITPAGRLSRNFGHGGSTRIKLGGRWGDEPSALALDRKGRIYVGGTYVSKKVRGMFVSRLRADGRQQMNFGPHGRVVVHVPGPEPFATSNLLVDGDGRVVVMHPYSTSEFTATGIVLARLQLRN